MSVLTAPLYTLLATDATLTAMLNTYQTAPAIFTIDPVPSNAQLPYIVTPGAVARVPNDTKNSRGLDIYRDLRCYTANTGSSILVEAIAARVYLLLHRQEITIPGYDWILSDCTGPVVANEQDVFGRIVTLRVVAQES